MANILNILLLEEMMTSDEDNSSLDSSSSDDEEWYEDEIVALNEINCRCYYRQHVPRVQNYIETVVHRYNAVDFQQHFRYVNTPNNFCSISFF